MTNQDQNSPSETADQQPSVQDSYVKLAMRNMVRKKGTSLKHFFLTIIGLFAFLIGISYLTR
jgi:hypothetical protein